MARFLLWEALALHREDRRRKGKSGFIKISALGRPDIFALFGRHHLYDKAKAMIP